MWAFEPSHDNHRCARATIDLNEIGNAVLRRAGLGAWSERRALVTKDARGRPLGGACTFVGATGREEETVEVVTLDEVLPPDRPVSIVHLDVEGYEGPALQGGLRTVDRWRPVLVIDMLPGGRLLQEGWFRELLAGLDCEKVGYIHDNTAFLPRS